MVTRDTRTHTPGRRAGVAREDAGSATPLQSDDGLALDLMDREAVVELVRRVTDIGQSYRQAAERMGQLYMYADSIRAHELTRRLDEPMRNASRNELMLRALLDELQACAQTPAQAASRDKRARGRRGVR